MKVFLRNHKELAPTAILEFKAYNQINQNITIT